MNDPECANIAVLGDLHGHQTLAYRLLQRWEREHGQRVHLILRRPAIWAPFRRL